MKLVDFLKLLRTGDIILPVFVSNVAMIMTMGASSSLIVQKVCSPGSQPSINEFICNDAEMVSQASSITTLGSTIRSVSTAVGVAVFGAWRDSTGRNTPLLLISELSQALSAFIFLMASWSWSTSPWLPVVLDAFLGGAFGVGVRNLASHCILIENSKPEDRTVTLQIFHTVIFLAALVSSIFRGVFLPIYGYRVFYTTIIGLHLFAALMFLMNTKDTMKKTSKKQKDSIISKFRTAFKPRINGSVVWLMTFCKALVHTYFGAEHVFSHYFYQQGFKFTVREGTIFGAYHLTIIIVGSLITPLIFNKKLNWSDFKIGIASSSLTAIAAVATAFAFTKTQLYLIAPLDLLKYLLYSIPQCILSKCVRHDELGIFTGFSSILGVFLPFGVNSLYHSTFALTSKTMPGAIYLISAVGNIIVLFLFCTSVYLYKPQTEEEETPMKSKEKEVKDPKKED